MAPKKHSNIKLTLYGFLTIAAAGYLGLSSYAVLALFTDQETVAPNNFATGTLDLVVTPDGINVPFTVADMAPGDSTVGAISVNNNGSLDLRYSVTSTTTEDVLAAQLDLTITWEASQATCLTAPVGPTLYNAGDLGSTGTINLIGNPAQGADAGDRTLAAGGTEVLCFQVSLPLSTDNSFQGVSTTANFVFDAEQVANNP